MTSTAELAERAYRDLIADLSPVLPHNLQPSDVKLDAGDLAVVVAAHGGGHFVSEALEADLEPTGAARVDTYDALAVRVAMPLNTAITSCGLAVVTAVQNYAARQVCEDVIAYRDANPPRYRSRREQAADYGVASIVTGGVLS